MTNKQKIIFLEISQIQILYLQTLLDRNLPCLLRRRMLRSLLSRAPKAGTDDGAPELAPAVFVTEAAPELCVDQLQA